MGINIGITINNINTEYNNSLIPIYHVDNIIYTNNLINTDKEVLLEYETR